MQKKKYIPRVSDILGIALILATVLLFLFSGITKLFGMSTWEIFVKFLLILPVFFVPLFFVIFSYKCLHMSIPVLPKSLGYNESAMLTVSSFGFIVLMQVLYGSLFPSTVEQSGIAQTDSVFGFLLLFFTSVVIPAVLEELFFRGVILRTLTVYRALLAILISSVVCALMHFSLEAFPLVFFCGFLTGSVYYATGSLTAAIGVNLSAKAVWFLAETVGVYVPARYALFMRILVAACVLLLAFGLPFLKKTVRAILADEDDASVLPSSQFWSVPIVLFLVLSVLIQLLGGAL